MARISCRYAGRAAVLFLALFVGIAACGIKRSPVPPKRTPPSAVGDLRAVVDGDRIHLSWSLPKTAVEGKSAVEGFHVFRWRSEISRPACPGCPKVYERIADIDVQTGTTEDPEDSLHFSHDGPLELGYRYSFKIMGYSKDGLTSNDSNILEFDY